MRHLLLCALLGGCGAAAPKHVAAPMVAPAPPGERAGAAAQVEEKLVITGTIELQVDDGPGALARLRADVEAAGGRVVHEHESGQDSGWSAAMKVRLPPGDVTGFVARVAAIGRVLGRRIETTDVSRAYFDQELALQNLRITMGRLQALLGGAGLKTADVLEIERELTRVRGEIERIEGEHRYLQDRIALATLDLTLTSTGTNLLAPRAAVYPGVRASMLFLVDAAPGVDEARLGVGATLWFHRTSQLELDLYPATDDGTGRAVIATLGGAGYSQFLGGGRRRFLNPYLGARMGYGWIDRHAFVAAAELGVELVKHERVVVEAAGRGLGLFHGDGVDAAVQVTLGVRVPF